MERRLVETLLTYMGIGALNFLPTAFVIFVVSNKDASAARNPLDLYVGLTERLQNQSFPQIKYTPKKHHAVRYRMYLNSECVLFVGLRQCPYQNNPFFPIFLSFRFLIFFY